MELKEMTEKVCDLFGCESTNRLTDKIKEALLSCERERYFDEYKKLCPDLSVDWLQRIYQFYLADREDKKQDYTPVALSRLIATLTSGPEDKVVYDCCTGSGSLCIQKWNLNKNLEFICEELDENVLPILLFNLCIRNVNATVINKNILSGEIFNTYIVKSGSRYSSIYNEMFPIDVTKKADVSISNPPFNIKVPVCQDIAKDLPEKYTCNYAFVANCLQRSDRCAIILPQGVLSSQNEMISRQFYIEKGWLQAVISLPENLFESTSVATCILLFDKRKTNKNVMLINAMDMHTEYVRDQNGEGDASHRNRIYHKTFNTFTDEQIVAICGLLHTEQKGYSKIVSYDELLEHKFNLSFGPYQDVEFPYSTHRDFNEIIDDINRVIRDRNVIRLTVNKVWAERLGLTEIIGCIENSNKVVKDLNELISKLSYKVKNPINENSYARISASKVFLIENTDKEKLSSIMPFFINMYKQHIYYLNEEENRYLRELRDAMLPFLMDGTLTFDK